MQKQQIPLKNSLLLLLAAIIWGIAFVAQSVGMKYVGGFTFNAVRSLIGAVVLIPLIFILKKRNYPSDSASTAARCCGAPPNRDAYFPIPVSYDRSLLKSYKFVTKPIIPHFPGTSRLFCISTIETADFQQEFTQFSNICGKYPLIHGAAPPSARRTGRWRQTRSRGAGDRWSSPPAW